jgi:hypothetical protein
MLRPPIVVKQHNLMYSKRSIRSRNAEKILICFYLNSFIRSSPMILQISFLVIPAQKSVGHKRSAPKKNIIQAQISVEELRELKEEVEEEEPTN